MGTFSRGNGPRDPRDPRDTLSLPVFSGMERGADDCGNEQGEIKVSRVPEFESNLQLAWQSTGDDARARYPGFSIDQI